MITLTSPATMAPRSRESIDVRLGGRQETLTASLARDFGGLSLDPRPEAALALVRAPGRSRLVDPMRDVDRTFWGAPAAARPEVPPAPWRGIGPPDVTPRRACARTDMLARARRFAYSP